MKNYLVILSMLLCPLFNYANNGKVAFAHKMENFSLDGDLKEWSQLKPNAIDLYLSEEANPTKDGKATFKSAYHKNQVYLMIQVKDNSLVSNTDSEWYTNDAVVIYLNFCHADKQSGVAAIVLNQEKVVVENHGKEKDRCHASFDEAAIKHKYVYKNGHAYYELAIDTDFEIENLQTMGLDVYILDIDKNKNKKTETEISWGPSNFDKYYMPGYLGDLLFVNTSASHFGTVSGQVTWQEKNETPLPQTVLIQSKTFSKCKITAKLDSLGKYEVTVPAGKYYVTTRDYHTDLFASNGYVNQKRINTFDKVEFEVKQKEDLRIDTLSLRTYSPPDYLFETKGVLLDFEHSDKILVDNFIESYKTYYNIPAVSLALIQDDKIVYSKNYGLANPINKMDFQENSVFQIASVTKSVFAFIVMRIAEKGIIDLDEPLYKYLAFPQIEHNKGYQQITARLILSHQTGLPNWAWGGTGGWKHGEKTDLAFLPGTQYQYSGEGYEYLQRVVEHLTSKSLSELLEEEVKKPLGIEKLYPNINNSIQQVTGHYGDQSTLWENNEVIGAAHSILTDAEAFANFVCELGKQKLLSKDTYQDMFTPLQAVTGFEHPDQLYWNQGIGLGFFTQESPLGKAVMHGGNNGDFQGEFVYYLKPKIGVVLFTNSNKGHKLGQELGRFLFHGKE